VCVCVCVCIICFQLEWRRGFVKKMKEKKEKELTIRVNDDC
jgi:hypothetical protein